MVRIVRATLPHLPLVAPLFNEYRKFYQKPDDLILAEQFMQQRFEQRDSIVLLALSEDEKAMGFAQLYRQLSSVSATNYLVLNDLFVSPDHRRHGIGRALLNESILAAREEHASKIVLETAPDNSEAQALYESNGFTKTDSSYWTYTLPLQLAPHHAPVAPTVHQPLARNGRSLVVITGVTSGLGAAMIDEFAHRGWMIAGCGRSVSEIAKLRGKFGSQHSFEIVDVADIDAVQQWGKTIQESCGGEINLLINNASIINRPAKSWDIPLMEFKKVIDVNVMGVVSAIHVMMPMMSSQGVIVNISSGWGRAGDSNVSAYCASKFAIEGLTQSMAKELPEGMAVVSLDPRDGVRTPMLQICCPEYMEQAPTPEAWAHTSVPFILALNATNNGQALTCPVPSPSVEQAVTDDKKKTGLTELGIWRGDTATPEQASIAPLIPGR